MLPIVLAVKLWQNCKNTTAQLSLYTGILNFSEICIDVTQLQASNPGIKEEHMLRSNRNSYSI